MITFRIVPHRHREGIEVVEILLNGQMCATIYPDPRDPQAIKLVSAHFAGELTRDNNFPAGIQMDTGERHFPPVPNLNITFDIRKYSLGLQGLVRC